MKSAPTALATKHVPPRSAAPSPSASPALALDSEQPMGLSVAPLRSQQQPPASDAYGDLLAAARPRDNDPNGRTSGSNAAPGAAPERDSDPSRGERDESSNDAKQGAAPAAPGPQSDAPAETPPEAAASDKQQSTTDENAAVDERGEAPTDDAAAGKPGKREKHRKKPGRNKKQRRSRFAARRRRRHHGAASTSAAPAGGTEAAAPPGPPDMAAGLDSAPAEVEPELDEPESAEPKDEPNADELAALDPNSQPSEFGPAPASRPSTADLAAAREEAAADEAVDIAGELSSIAEEAPAPELPKGGGGGGAPIVEPPPLAPVQVSATSPEAGLGQLAGARLDQMMQALPSVSAAATASVDAERAQLAASPPTYEFDEGGDPAAPPAGAAAAKQRASGRAVKAGPTPPTVVAEPPPPPKAAPPIAAVARMPVPRADDAPASDADRAHVTRSIANLPTTDPALNADLGPTPTVELTGSADPAVARASHTALYDDLRGASATAQDDIATRLPAEAMALPRVHRKFLARAARAAPNAQGPVAAGKDVAPAIGVIAELKQGDELRREVAQTQTQMTSERQQHDERARQQNEAAQQEIRDLERGAARDQQNVRDLASAESAALRRDWNAEVDTKLADARKQGDERLASTTKDVEDERRKADDRAQEQFDKGAEQAEAHQKRAEDQAEAEKKNSESDSGGLFGWAKSKLNELYNKVRDKISQIIESARKLVREAIATAKKLAADVINAARDKICGWIKAAADFLCELADRLLAELPGLRDKFKALIRSAAERATDKIRELADGLNDAIQRGLDVLGQALDAALGLLEKGLQALLKHLHDRLQAAIKFAEATVQAIGAFATLIKDIAANPGQWLRNLGASVVDGIRNHLWTAFKAAVREWFESKVLEVLGIGAQVVLVLKQGGLDLKNIAATAWEGLKAAIPPALIGLLIEKLVAMVVPAAGAVLAIIEGLQAAWGTVSRIIAAFQQFMAFLKAVKSGNAGPQFARALASAAIVVIDFVANWLIRRLAKAGRKIGSKFGEIAKKLLKKLKKAGKKKGKRKKDNNKKNKNKKKDKRERLREIIEAIRPPIQSLLARGVGKLRLKAQLLWYRTRYRLSGLAVEGKKIVARLNPWDDVTPAEELQVGKELENLLREAEKKFLLWYTRHESSPKKRDAGAANDADIDDIISFRDARMGKPFKIDESKRQFVSDAIKKNPRTKQWAEKYDWGVNPITTATGSTVNIGNPSSFASFRVFDDTTDPSYKQILASLAGHKGSWSSLPAHVRTTINLEAARMPGVLGATRVSAAMAGAGLMSWDEVVGSKNPMEPQGSALAADKEYWDRSKEDRRNPGEIEPTGDAGKARVRRITQIFDALIRAARQEGDKAGVMGSGAGSLAKVASAADAFFKARLPKTGDVDPDAIERALRALRIQMLLFLKNFKG